MEYRSWRIGLFPAVMQETGFFIYRGKKNDDEWILTWYICKTTENCSKACSRKCLLR